MRTHAAWGERSGSRIAVLCPQAVGDALAGSDVKTARCGLSATRHELTMRFGGSDAQMMLHGRLSAVLVRRDAAQIARCLARGYPAATVSSSVTGGGQHSKRSGVAAEELKGIGT